MEFISLGKIASGRWADFKKGLPEACLKAMKSGHVTYGSYDVVIYWEAPSLDEANKIVSHVLDTGLLEMETLVVAASIRDVPSKF